MLSGRQSRTTSFSKIRQSRQHVKQRFFTLKRPLLFQVRKSLVEYVDEELLKMDTSVFYQRIFILAKNVEPVVESTTSSAENLNLASNATIATIVEGDTAPIVKDGDEHYSQQSSTDEPEIPIRVVENNDVEKVTATFRFDEDDEVPANLEEQESEKQEPEPEPEPEIPVEPKDIFAQFTDKLLELHKRCRSLSYTPDPMCGLVIYMNEYTMMMLESGEDMMAIFCGELLKIVDEYWQSNRVFMMEDHIKELYTKDLLFRRHPAVFLNEKFPPSTPTDEYLMGTQHVIMKEKLLTICNLIRESMAPTHHTEVVHFRSSGTSVHTDLEGGDSSDADEDDQRLSRSVSKGQSLTKTVSESLQPEIFRKLLPEIQRIELVLSATRFYFTLQEFVGLYGKVPFAADDDGLYWPIQNSYVPPNIFRRTPYDINLTFADYAADMKRRLQEEQDKNREELEAAAAAADANAAGQSQPSARQSQPPARQSQAPVQQSQPEEQAND